MKKLLTLLAVLFVYANSYAVVNVVADKHQLQDQFENLDPILQDMKADDFLALTPKKYRQMTGKKLGIKKALQLKAAQKVFKKATKGDMDIPKGLYIVGALFGWSWLIMGLLDGFEGNNWWINLLLLFLCFIPGVVHAFIKMKDYY